MASTFAVELVSLGEASRRWLSPLATALPGPLDCRSAILPEVVDASFAFLPARGQYYSSAILARLEQQYGGGERHSCLSPTEASSHGKSLPSRVVLGVADVDLATPIFTFVFGEALDAGPCAVISGYRLRQEFYGLPPDPALFAERLLKMAIHELGHTRGLRHCAGHRCVMATSYNIERVDLKSAAFCPSCSRELHPQPSHPSYARRY